jgi:mRNA interferase MazF
VVSRGDVWLMLPDIQGTPSDPQPCVVLSPPEIHDYLGVVTVAPVTPGGTPAAYRVPIKLGDRAGLIRLEQLRTVEKRALTRQVGAVEGKSLTVALATLREMFAE